MVSHFMRIFADFLPGYVVKEKPEPKTLPCLELSQFQEDSTHAQSPAQIGEI